MNPPSCPVPRDRVIELYFLEHRAKVLDLAAFLDRLERAAPARGDQREFLVDELIAALHLLTDGRGERARRVLEHFSDPSLQPLATTHGVKGAYGAFPHRRQEARSA